MAADSTLQSNAMARDLLVKLGTLQAAHADSMRLIQPDGNGAAATYTLKVAASSSPSDADATILLTDGKDRSLLWSGEFTQPRSRIADLK